MPTARQAATIPGGLPSQDRRAVVVGDEVEEPCPLFLPRRRPLDEDDRSAAATMLQATNGLFLLADIWRESGPRTEDEYGTKDEGNKVPQPSSAATALRTPVAMKTVPSTTA